VRPKLVQHDDLPGLKGRSEELLHVVSLEEFGVGRTLDGQSLAHPSFEGDRGYGGLVLAIRFLGTLP
jgi:hypothetical protein